LACIKTIAKAEQFMSSDSTFKTSARTTRVVALGALMLLSSLSIQWYSPYIRPYSHAAVGLILALGVAWLMSRSTGWRTRLDHLSKRVANLTTTERYALYGWAFVAPVLLSQFVLDPIPHIPDGFAYLYQAKLFAAGQLFAESPAVPEAFPAPWSVDLDGRVFTVFPPGWSGLLAFGVVTGLTAFVNPAIGALSIVVMWHLWSELFDSKRANFALVLCVLSPFYLFMSAGFMSHNASLLASSAFALAFVRGSRSGSLIWGAVAALSIAFQILVRPVSALFVFAAVVGFFAIARRSAASWKLTFCAAVGGGIGTAIYGIYNRALVGEWGVPPLYFLTPANRFGFGDDIGLPWSTSFPTPGHDVIRAALNLNFNMAVMNHDLFGWPLVSLLFVFVALLFTRLSWQHGLCAATIAGAVVIYAGYWYNGVAFGARFYYCLLPYLVMLTVEGIRATPDVLRSFSSRLNVDRTRAFIATAVIAFMAYGMFFYIPRTALTAPYWNQRKISFELYEELDSVVQPGDLVLVDADSEERYNPLFVKNEIRIEQSPVVYAWDRNDAVRAQLLAQFPDRRVVRWRYPIERLAEQTASAQLRRRLGASQSPSR
jgi:hypothetical protein